MFTLLVQAKVNGPWAEVGVFATIKILYNYFRSMNRPPKGFLGAKVLREDGSVDVIF